jgi:hypothetical protein
VVAAGKVRESHLVDRIAICRRWAAEAEHDVRLNCWEKTDPDGTRLSDHPTVAIDLNSTTPAKSQQPSADAAGSPSPWAGTTIGYGYQPWRAGVIALALVLVGRLVLWGLRR